MGGITLFLLIHYNIHPYTMPSCVNGVVVCFDFSLAQEADSLVYLPSPSYRIPHSFLILYLFYVENLFNGIFAFYFSQTLSRCDGAARTV